MNPKANRLNAEGLRLYAAGAFPAALEKFTLASDEDSREPEYPNNRGTCFLQLENYKEARTCFETAIGLRPGIALYHVNLGLALLAANDAERAEQEFTKALDLDKNYFPALSHLGLLLYGRKEYNKAAEIWKRAAGLKQDASTENSLGMALMQLNDLDPAREHFKKSLRIEPENALAHYNLGVLYQKQKKYEAADREYSAAISISPESFTAYYNRAIVLTALNQRKEAIKSLKEFLRLCPADLGQPIIDAKKRIRELEGN